MLKKMLNYRHEVQHYFSNQAVPELRTRVPSPETWEIASSVVSALELIMDSFILFQPKNGWLLSDAVHTLGKLYLHYHKVIDELTSESDVESEYLLQQPPGASIDDQLKVYKRKIAITLLDRLEPLIKPLMELRQIDDSYAHHYLALAIEPKYKELRFPFMALHAANVEKGRQLARNYDETVIIPLLSRLKGVDINVTSNNENGNHAMNKTSKQSTNQTSKADAVPFIDRFVNEEETPGSKRSEICYSTS